MMTEISSNPAPTAGASTENASPNVETIDTAVERALTPPPADPKATIDAKAGKETATAALDQKTTTPIVTPDGKVAYVPNFKYKAALQEKELDPFFHGLIKDAESEKKVKDLFTKVDAFDFIKGKKEHAETQFNSLLGDYNNQTQIVQRFNQSVKENDLSSAFRTAGITKEQVFKWTQQQLQLMEMPPDQRAQYEQQEQVRQQKSELEERFTGLQKEFQTQAVQTRTMQLDIVLNRPDVAKFANAWDAHGEPGSFRDLVIEEAKKTYYASLDSGKPVDLSSEQAVAMVMQRFGKFLNLGEPGAQSPQAIPSNQVQQQKPVIPNVVGKAASPIKKVPRNLDDLKKIAKELGN